MSYWTDEAHGEAYGQRGNLLFEEITRPQQAVIVHRCDACGHAIGVGRPYQRQVSMCRGDRSPAVFKSHLDCYLEIEA
jgi:hypothetical protein